MRRIGFKQECFPWKHPGVPAGASLLSRVQSFLRVAYEHLRQSLTRNNLWVYILSALEDGPATPGEIRKKVQSRHGFAPAAITFYSVLYKLRREGLVQRTSEEFRTAYGVTAAGRAELARARELLEKVKKSVTRV